VGCSSCPSCAALARTVIILGYSLSGLLLFAAARINSPEAVITGLCVSVGALYFSEPAFWATAVHLSTPQNSLAESSQPQLHPKSSSTLAGCPLSSGAAVGTACAALWICDWPARSRTATAILCQRLAFTAAAGFSTSNPFVTILQKFA